MYLYPLTDNLQEPDFGGKASGLSEINTYKLDVPFGYAVRKTAHEYYVLYQKFPDELTQELTQELGKFNAPQLIVRSSAIGEDSEDFSFAGQLDSFVVDNNLEAVTQGILQCWESIHNDRVQTYQHISGNVLENMGVVIQNFVVADFSGVLFTKSPTDEKLIYTEYVQGGAEPLVSGKVTPEFFSATTDFNLVGGKEVPFDYKTLLQKATYLKESFGKHLDIEWVSYDNTFYFIQARPIKVVEKSKVYWTNTNLNENYPTPISHLLYSIARDSYYHYFKNLAKLMQLGDKSIRALEYDFSNTVGIFGNRIYYNMTSIHNIFAASPLSAYFQDAFNNFVGYQEDDVSSATFPKKTTLLKLALRLIRFNISLEKSVVTIENKVNAYVEKVNNAKNFKDLTACYYEFLDLRFNQWYDASLADLFSMIHYKLLGSFTKQFYGQDHIGVHNVLIQAIPNLISNQPLLASWKILKAIKQVPEGPAYFQNTAPKEILFTIRSNPKWTRVNELVENYLTEWGFRCSGELMMLNENYIESPTKFIELLQSYMRFGHEDPELTVQKKDGERRVFVRKLVGKIFKKRHILFPLAIIETGLLFFLSRLCRHAIKSRERVRYKQAQMYYNFKKTTFKIGDVLQEKGVLAHSKDILYLSYKEIGSLIASSDMFSDKCAETIAVRKASYAEESQHEYPVNFDTNFGERPNHPAEYILDIQGGTEFSGLAASGGKKRAKVKVLESVLEASKINAGEILVTKQTDPGWAPLFPIIGGIIVERGGALSHGAIVAREFGIPAVVGIDGITSILKDNDEVLLDGDTGKIYIIQP